MTLNDAILAATGGQTVNDGLREWYSLGIANPQNYALNDLERVWLKIQIPTSPATTISDLWKDFLLGIGGIIPGTLNDMQLQYWLDVLTPPPLGPNQHSLLVGDGGSAYGFVEGNYGSLTPLAVALTDVRGLFVGGNDVMYLEFVGGVQIAGVLNIEVRNLSGRVICAWDAGAQSYKSSPYSGLYNALAQDVGNTITVGIVTL